MTILNAAPNAANQLREKAQAILTGKVLNPMKEMRAPKVPQELFDYLEEWKGRIETITCCVPRELQTTKGARTATGISIISGK